MESAIVWAGMAILFGMGVGIGIAIIAEVSVWASGKGRVLIVTYRKTDTE